MHEEAKLAPWPRRTLDGPNLHPGLDPAVEAGPSATHPARLEPKRAARAETDSEKVPGRAREP